MQTNDHLITHTSSGVGGVLLRVVLGVGLGYGAFNFPLRAVDLPPGFVVETLATNLNAATAVAVAPAPDPRLFIAEQTGRVLVVKDNRLLTKPALTLHVTDYWERGLLGLALAPNFPREPYLFAFYVTDRPFVHHVLSRFTMVGDDIDPASERILFEGDNQANLGGVVPAGHQGGVLRFGQDGTLYVSVGEQTAGEPAQHLDTLQGKILRLNPDGSIPQDNPFLAETKGKYRAIYARGVRNSFGLAVQPKEDGGRRFFTDVGASAFEEVNELAAGANYGWPQAEGFSTNAAFKNPLYAYPPLVGQSIVGGTFCPRNGASAGRVSPAPASGPSDSAKTAQSELFPDKWRGRFFFADFMKHWVKALDPSAPTNILTFARGLNGPVATEFAPDGSFLVLNRGAVWRDPNKFVANAGSLLRIRYAGHGALGAARPPENRSALKSAALGLPMDARLLPGRVPRLDWEQQVNLGEPLAVWLPDGEWQPFLQVKARVFLPAQGQAQVNEAGTIDFPPGTVFVREFSFPAGAEGDKSRSLRVVERRLHVIGEGESYGASYSIDEQGDGTLVEDGEAADLGRSRSLEPGKVQHSAEVAWWFPALEPRLGRPLTSPMYWIPITLAEWNQSSGDGQTALAELIRMKRLMDAGARANAQASKPPPYADWRSAASPAESRVRAYLQANCAVCHQPGGASRGVFDARITTPLAKAGIVNGELAAGDLGIVGAKVVVPGAPEKSILLRRLRDTGFFRMPPTQVHSETSPIVPVLEEWIRSLAN